MHTVLCIEYTQVVHATAVHISQRDRETAVGRGSILLSESTVFSRVSFVFVLSGFFLHPSKRFLKKIPSWILYSYLIYTDLLTIRLISGSALIYFQAARIMLSQRSLAYNHSLLDWHVLEQTQRAIYTITPYPCRLCTVSNHPTY
jgi:hypothetical protein